MSQREWDNAQRIARDDPGSVVVTVQKGSTPSPGSLDVSKMPAGVNVIP